MALPRLNAVLRRIRQAIAPAGPDSASDAQLLAAYLDGDAQAFEALLRRHGPMVQGVCRRTLGNVHDAEDAFQAVFLVLARKAASLDRPESLAGWLYGVAGRTARKARVAATRRRRREEAAAAMTREPSIEETTASPELDEEVSRLPEKYRLPVVLCYLEGESIEEAARRTCCSAGAVKMRLLRARELLRGRLERRGAALSAVALATLLEGPAAPAAVPDQQVDLTLKAVEAFTVGSADGALGAVALAEGVLRDMALAKTKLAVAAILGLGALGVGIGLGMQGRDQPVPKEPRQGSRADARKPAAGPVARAAVTAANNRFGLELLGRVAKPDRNAFLSPYSLSAALSMAYAGARGETAAEMARALHFAPEQSRWHPAFAALSADLRPGGKAPPYELYVANRLWGQSGYPFEEPFLKIARENYGGGFQPVDFRADTEAARQTINLWVKEQTQDRIKELVRVGELPRESRLVLTNAIYFKAKWAFPFRSEATEPADFHAAGGKVKVPMMHGMPLCGYAETATYQALSLAYRGNALSMVLVLPRKADGLADVEKGLNAEQLGPLLTKLRHDTMVEVFLPKFKLLESYELGAVLPAMGMRRAFAHAGADFSGISPEPFFLDRVMHQALVSVDEKGTEAAGETELIGVAGDERTVFKADHPFLFLIRENRTGTVLFLGRLVNPK